ncbi:ribonucleoside-diphosphate reductase large subunit-like [Triplophysa rosa]|uniref:ribonucleoside-diphosphate reductase large subunit-like n=1 Tax=Triplophysa rosa TaxID=992332 RepID=UPI002545BE46|nr:ribonucleoside-diphosphate reductase large subunit-like [Triplophysa rosa]
MSEEEIYQLISTTCAAMSLEHPDYSKIASNAQVELLHKSTPGFIEATKTLYKNGLLNESYYNTVIENQKFIEETINYQKDFRFDFFGISTLQKAYLLKDYKVTIERPQDLFMRVAITVSNKPTELFNKEKTKKTYNMISDGYYTQATPTLFNSGLKVQQLSSCFLIANESDSIEGIFNTIKDCALISKTAGGIGVHCHNIRAAKSIIKSTNGESGGLIPFLKIFNETARCVDQGGGKRKGSFVIYLEPWHADIEAFLELRKNIGAEEFRARDLFYALWVPDLFMQRVINDENWTLMSPDTAEGLSDVYGDEFNKLYKKYEEGNIGTKTLSARKLFSEIVEAQIEAGQPYFLYKDSINRKSNQKNIGTIKSSNLCAEIVEYSDDKETAVCNLASICLPSFVNSEGKFDYIKLEEIAELALENTDNLIDISYYPTKKTEYSNLRHRPAAIGVQGLADVFFKMKLPYESKEAAEVNKKIFSTIYYGTIKKSMELAKKYGPYQTYKGSPSSEGILQFDMWNVEPISADSSFDWKWLKGEIAKHGLRNSLTTACMPTASTSIIMMNTESFQIQTSNVFKRQTLSGEFLLVNKYLVNELEKISLWNKEIYESILFNNGSIQNIGSIPEEIKKIYKTTWEISQKVVIDMSADRSPYIDQTQSLNLWLEKPTFKQVCSMHMYSWEKGLKTGMYYLRSRPSSDAMKMTVSKEILNKYEKQEECLDCQA